MIASVRGNQGLDETVSGDAALIHHFRSNSDHFDG